MYSQVVLKTAIAEGTFFQVKGMRIGQNRFSFTAYDTDQKGIQVPLVNGKIANNWFEVEQHVRNDILPEPEFNHAFISVGGEALEDMPHGAICVYGNKDALESWIIANRDDSASVKAPFIGKAIRSPEEIFAELSVSKTSSGISKTRAKSGGSDKFQGRERGAKVRRTFAHTFLEEKFKDESGEEESLFFLLIDDTGYPNVPGGKRMLTESTTECAIREFHEETGIDIGKLGIDFGSLEQEHDKGSKMKMFFYRVPE